MAPTPDHRPNGEPGVLVIIGTLFCVAMLFTVLTFARPEIEPRQWPRTGEWECTR